MVKEKPATYDMWSASARHAYDAMEARALNAEAKLIEAETRLGKVRSGLDYGINPEVTHDTLSWNAAMMSVVNNMLQEVSSSLNPDQIFDIATRQICQFLNTSSVYIFDWNQEHKTSTILAEFISHRANKEEHIPGVGNSYQLDEIFESLLTGTEDFWVSHHDNENLPYTEVLEYKRYGVKTSLFVPLYAGDELIGFVEAWDTVQRREFSPQQTEFVVYIADQIAGSVRMAQLHRALVESEQRYRTLMDTIESGVARIDVNGKIQFVNRQFATLMNMPVEDLLQQNLKTLWRRKATTTPIPGEYYIDDDEGQKRWVYVTHADIPGENDQIVGEAVVYQDITRRKESEQLELQMRLENERMDLIARFITDTSHEFYTPISVINTRLFMMRRKFSDSEILNALDSIEQQADNITGLVRALVEMTRLDTAKSLTLEKYNLSLLVQQVVMNFQSQDNDSQPLLHFEADDPQIIIPADAERLGRAISEVIENAINHTPEHGSIVIRVRVLEKEAQVMVRDSGPGMNDETKERLFERFYREDEARTTRGPGLGLSITKRVVELHHGNIQVESQPGKGSTFTITLPRKEIEKNVFDSV